jgi:AcrR family transcriptional regulator
MLDACAALVDEVGCDGLTTTLLAERARVAIGSVYQFFPDKQAVITSLTSRNLEDYLERLRVRLGEIPVGHWYDSV